MRPHLPLTVPLKRFTGSMELRQLAKRVRESRGDTPAVMALTRAASPLLVRDVTPPREPLRDAPGLLLVRGLGTNHADGLWRLPSDWLPLAEFLGLIPPHIDTPFRAQVFIGRSLTAFAPVTPSLEARREASRKSYRFVFQSPEGDGEVNP